MIALLFCAGFDAARATTTVPESGVVFPSRQESAVGLLPLLVVSHPVGRTPAEVALTDETGAPVPFTSTSVASVDSYLAYELIVPAGPLVDGGSYVLSLSQGGSPVDQAEFAAADLALDPPAPPIPVTRVLGTDLARSDGETFDQLSYRLCTLDRPVLFLVAEGPSEPAAPTPAAPGPLWAAERDSFGLGQGIGDLAPADTLRLWFGTFDAAGAFSGWTGPDEVVMPDAGCTVRETMPGMTGGESTTPTAFATCPPYGTWVEAAPVECVEDTGGAMPSTACGCGSAPGGSAAGLVVLLAGLTRRRRW